MSEAERPAQFQNEISLEIMAQGTLIVFCTIDQMPSYFTTLFQHSSRLTVCLFLGIATLPASAAINLSDPIPVNPALTLGKLENGLTYYIQKNDTPRKKVELRLVVKAGSVLEDDDQQGLAHFTEHMAFNGSTHFKKNQLISYLQSIGVKFGADLNAFTSFDETVYVLPIPTDKKAYLKTGFQVLADWAQGVKMTNADIDKERDIILEEARLGKGADDRMSKQLLPEVFNGSRYADRLPIGKEDIIKTFKYDALRRFYRDWYRPDLMAVIVVGDIDPAEGEQMVREYFSGLKNPVPSRPRLPVTIPKNVDSKALVITDKEATNNLLMIRYPLQAIAPRLTIGDYRQDIIKSVYKSMLNRRLSALTEQAQPPFLGASAGTEQVVEGYESFMSAAVLSQSGISAAMNALVQEKNSIRRFGFTIAEFERAKKIEAREYETMYNERNNSLSSSFASEYIRNFLHAEPIPGLKNEYAYFKEFYEGITLEELDQYARKATPDDSTKLVFYVGSDKAGEVVPGTADLLKFASQAENRPIQAYKEKESRSALMNSPPTAGTIVSEKENKLLGLTELGLSNGVKVILKKTDFKSDQILMSARRFGGMSVYGDQDFYNAWYANPIVWEMGMSNFSAKDVQETLAGKYATVRTSIDNYTENFGGTSSNDDLESMLQLLYLRMTSPRKDKVLYQSFINTQKELARNSWARPETIFSDQVVTALYQNHPRVMRQAKVEDFDKLDLERSMEIFQDRYGSAKDLTFIFVGSFDLDKIKPLIATYLASLPATDIKTGYQDLKIQPVRGIVKKDVKVGSEAKSIISISFTGPAIYSREENTRFHAMLDVLNLKIIDVIREKQGLIYSGGVNGSIQRIPQMQYGIDIDLPCSPDNVNKVIAAMFAEIQKLQTAGPSAEDVNKVKQAWLQDHQVDLRSNESWLDHLQTATLYQTDPESILTTEKRIKAVNANQIKDAANRYFNMQNYVQVVLYPEDKKDK